MNYNSKLKRSLWVGNFMERKNLKTLESKNKGSGLCSLGVESLPRMSEPLKESSKVVGLKLSSAA